MSLDVDAAVDINTSEYTVNGSNLFVESFVTVEQYAIIVNTTVTPGSSLESAIEAALDAACAEIRHELSQDIDFVSNDTVLIDGTGTQKILLPQLPVVSVSEVKINDTVITDYLLRPNGIVYRRCGWPLGVGNIEFTYDHGFAPIPADLVNIAVQSARAGLAVSPGGIVSESISGYSYSRSAVAAGVAQFKDVLDRFRVDRVA